MISGWHADVSSRASSPCRTVTAIALLVTTLAVGCTSATSNMPAPTTTTARPASSSTTLTGESTMSPSGPPATLTSESAAVTCDDPTAMRGTADVDGDGADDTITYAAGSRALVVCTANGAVSWLPWYGMGEAFALADIEPDGRTEVFFGGTTASAAGTDVATWEDGRLVAVTAPDGSRLGLWHGFGTWDEQAQRPAVYDEWGCEDVDDDGTRELVTAHAELTDAGQYDVTIIAYRIDETVATEVHRSMATATTVGDQADPILDRGCLT